MRPMTLATLRAKEQWSELANDVEGKLMGEGFKDHVSDLKAQLREEFIGNRSRAWCRSASRPGLGVTPMVAAVARWCSAGESGISFHRQKGCQQPDRPQQRL